MRRWEENFVMSLSFYFLFLGRILAFGEGKLPHRIAAIIHEDKF
mgnify:CR=1